MGATRRSQGAGDDAETLFARMKWKELRERGMETKEMARLVGVRPSAISQFEHEKHGLGNSIAGWAKALGFRSVGEFRVAAYRWYLARHDLYGQVQPESATVRSASRHAASR